MITETLANDTSLNNWARGNLSRRMVQLSKSQKAWWPNSLLTLRQVTRTYRWNVRSMNQTGRTAVIAAKRQRYNLEVLGLRETRWIQSRKFKPATGERFLYLRHEDHNAPHTIHTISWFYSGFLLEAGN